MKYNHIIHVYISAYGFIIRWCFLLQSWKIPGTMKSGVYCFFPLIRILSYLPVERHFPLCRSVLRFAVRSPRVLRSSGGLHPALVVREKQRILQHLLTPYKTPWSQEDSGSCLTVATPEVRGNSLRCGCSFGFSSAHLLGWMRRFCRYSLAFLQSWLAGALRRVCVCERERGLLVLQSWMERLFSPVPLTGPAAYQWALRVFPRGAFALRYADGGCPMPNSRLWMGLVRWHKTLGSIANYCGLLHLQ